MTGPEISLHLGAHRTGTTALQHFLARRAARLAGAGIAFLGPERLRREAALEALYAPGDGMRPAARTQLSVLGTLCANEVEAGRGRIFLSEENIIGSIARNVARAELYPDVTSRLERFSRELPAAPARVFLTVRNFAEYWRSAYAQRRLAGFARPIDAESLARSPGASWLPLIAAVRSAYPQARLIVARHRRHPRFVPALAVAMIGNDLGIYPKQAPVTINASLPADTLDALDGMPRGPERSQMILAARTSGRAGVDPFTPEQTAAQSARFEEEWAAIEAGAVPGVEILAMPRAEEAS